MSDTNYDEMNVDALKDEIRKRNEDGREERISLSGNKGELIDALKADDKAAAKAAAKAAKNDDATSGGADSTAAQIGAEGIGSVDVAATAAARGITPDAIGQPTSEDPGLTNPANHPHVDPEVIGEGVEHNADGSLVHPPSERPLDVGLESGDIDRRRIEALREWREQHPNATVIPPSLLPPAYGDPEIVTPGFPAGIDDPAAPVAMAAADDDDPQVVVAK